VNNGNGLYGIGTSGNLTVNQRPENDGANGIHTTTVGAENIPVGATMVYNGQTFTATSVTVPDPFNGNGVFIAVSPNIFNFPSPGEYTFNYYTGTITGGTGTDYLTGHKIKILGTDLGGVTPNNDAIVTVTSTANGVIQTTTISGTAAGSTFASFNAVTGTNYDVGSGFTLASINRNNDGSISGSISNEGLNYVTSDVLTLSGSNLTAGTSPGNDMTITVQNVYGMGAINSFVIAGTAPDVWPVNSISDGGNDQYDTGNYIDTNLASEINYNSGNTVSDGTTEFGAGSSYSFVYDTGIFGLLATGSNVTTLGTSGSGPDGGGTTDAGNLYGPSTASQTFDNAVGHINIVGNSYAGSPVSFIHTDDGDEIDILIPDDGDGAGVGITRDSGGGGIYNPYREGEWDSDVSPGGTLWNVDGWEDFSNVESRIYQPLYAAFGYGGLGNKIVGAECVMYLPDNGKYYTVKFSSWTQGGNGGGFAYTRTELDLDNLQEGIRFSDGTSLKSAAGVGPVKLTSPGNRKIEEVYGYKQISVTAVTTSYLNTTASRTVVNDTRFWIDTSATTIDNILENTQAAGITDPSSIQFSLDEITWYTWNGSTSFTSTERGYGVSMVVQNLNYSVGDPIYFRYNTGGAPVVWWDKTDLPGGASNFRGATIDYHAFTGDATWIGTIHIVDDDGEDHITHTEVMSGSSDGDNDDLWVVQNEGTISYRRIDGDSATVKIQWGAKVFYGSEIWD
jgi:hypothetical protein